MDGADDESSWQYLLSTGIFASVLISNRVPMALAHLDLQIKKKKKKKILAISFICTDVATA